MNTLRMSTYRMHKLVNFVIEVINKQNTTLFIFLILCFNFLSFELNSNEEQYLALAKHFLDPSWIPGSFSLSEFPGTRLIYQIITGFFLQYFSFEQVTFAGRLINFLLFAFPLGKLMRLLKINNLEFFFIFQVIYFPHQTFFAGEWIFQGFEAKTLAYVFIFYSLYYLLKDKYRKSIIFTLIATYFHILVGGWFFLTSIAYLLLVQKVDFKKVMGYAILYALLSLPFAAYLAQEILLNTATAINGVNLNWIYVYFRAPHHVGLFKDIIYFFREHLPGVLLSLSFFFICLFLDKELKDNFSKKLNRLNILIFSMIFLSLIIGYFDHTGFFLKYYPFRISAISMLLIVLQFAVIIKNYLKEQYRFIIYGGLLLIALPVFAYASATNIYVMARPKDAPLDEMASFVKANTAPSDVFIMLGIERGTALSFTRKTERKRFVVYKFVPSGGDKLYEWYMRIQEKEKAERDTRYLFTLKDRYGLDYLVSPLPYEHPNLALVFENKAYYVYKIN